ncbi:hypothetical protein FWF93_03080 [Candidatus Saccharibacteria bacterium]|nr:hypothetical protein [Candidatus Saccharibacteria bacterium]
MSKKVKIVTIILAVLTVPVNLFFMLLGGSGAFIWFIIALAAVILLKIYAPKMIWIALIAITAITLIGTFPRMLMPGETKQIKEYLISTYSKDTFEIKRSSLSVEGTKKFCSSGATWLSFCFGFTMFHWTYLDAIIIDENGDEFRLHAEKVGNRLGEFSDDYSNRQDIKARKKEFIENMLIPTLKEYSITDVNYSYSEYHVDASIVVKEYLDKNKEEQMWEEIRLKAGDKWSITGVVVNVKYYRESPPGQYNEIDTYHLTDSNHNRWDSNI